MLPNFDVKADRCGEFVSKKWTAKADYQDEGFEDEYVQEIIKLADAYDYDAFVMNYQHTSWEDYGKVQFFYNCGEPIDASDLKLHKNGHKSAFIRKARTCVPLPDVREEGIPRYNGVLYNVGEGLQNLYDTYEHDPELSYTLTTDFDNCPAPHLPDSQEVQCNAQSQNYLALITWEDNFGITNRLEYYPDDERQVFYIPNMYPNK